MAWPGKAHHQGFGKADAKGETPNKITADARETFRRVFENLAPEAEGWIQAAAKKNPAKGAVG